MALHSAAWVWPGGIRFRAPIPASWRRRSFRGSPFGWPPGPQTSCLQRTQVYPRKEEAGTRDRRQGGKAHL